jgi:hypothetical protein
MMPLPIWAKGAFSSGLLPLRCFAVVLQWHWKGSGEVGWGERKMGQEQEEVVEVEVMGVVVAGNRI